MPFHLPPIFLLIITYAFDVDNIIYNGYNGNDDTITYKGVKCMAIKHLTGEIAKWFKCVVVDDCLFVSSDLPEQEQQDIISGAMRLSRVIGGIA